MFLPLVDVFGDDDVTQLFSEESIVGAWLEVERALARAGRAGVSPRRPQRDRHRGRPGPDRPRSLRERSLVVGYPILPLLEQIEQISPEAARHSTGGRPPRTSWTPVALLLGRALDRIGALVDALGDELRGKGRAPPNDRDARPDARSARRADHLRWQGRRSGSPS